MADDACEDRFCRGELANTSGAEEARLKSAAAVTIPAATWAACHSSSPSVTWSTGRPRTSTIVPELDGLSPHERALMADWVTRAIERSGRP